MGKLIYGMLTSLDGYTEDKRGDFTWATPEEPVHEHINELCASVGTYLYGRRMYDMMAYWETADAVPDQPQVMLDWARQWKMADKVVYSRTLTQARTARTRIEREFDAESVQRLKASVNHDIGIGGPELAGHAVLAGLVDELLVTICPVAIGEGTRFLPPGARLDLQLIDQRAFDNGVVVVRYGVRNPESAPPTAP